MLISELKEIIDKVGGGLGHLLEVVLFIVVAIFAVASITEISARDNYLGFISNQIQTSNQQIASNASSENSSLTSDAVLDIRKKIRIYEYLHSKLEALISVGAEKNEQTLVYIRREVENLGNFNNQEEEKGYYYSSILYIFQRDIMRLSSDYLLAIAIMTCGAIGSTVGSIRTNHKFSWRSILFGLSSGFIVFLAIKGSKQIFLLQAQGQLIQFNPYSSGFAGLLAGMFTEKTFEFLGTVTDAVFNKLKKVIEE